MQLIYSYFINCYFLSFLFFAVEGTPLLKYIHHLTFKNTLARPNSLFRIVSSPVLNFAPWLELHHVVVIGEPNSNLHCAIDFSPVNQTSPHVLSLLLQGHYVPAELRVRWFEVDNKKLLAQGKKFDHEISQHYFLSSSSQIDEGDMTPLHLIDVTNKQLPRHILSLVNDIRTNWYGDEMNLYVHNCQHFSFFVFNQLMQRLQVA